MHTTEAATNYLTLLFDNGDWANVGDAAGLQNSATAGSLYLSAHTANPGAAGNQATSEIAYTGYARVAVARSSGGFPISTNTAALAAVAAWGAMSGGTGGTITYFGIGTDSTGAGHLLFRGTVTPNITVTTPVNPQLASGVFLTVTTS